MGIADAHLSSSAADALFPKVRQRVLAVLFGTPDRSFCTNEVISQEESLQHEPPNPLDNLSRPGGSLKPEPPDAAEIAGLMEVDERLVKDLIVATQRVADALSAV